MFFICEWINKLWYTHTMECYLAARNELSTHKKTWRKLKCILLSEKSQSEWAIYCMISIILYSGRKKL